MLSWLHSEMKYLLVLHPFFFFIWQKSATKCDCFTDSLDGKQVLSVRNGAAVAAKVILCAEQFE